MRLENGYYIWQKGESVPLSAHFTTDEFACPCTHVECQEQRIAQNFVVKVQKVRDGYARPVRIDSGYRCQWHQADLAAAGYETAKGISQHQLGNAGDLKPYDPAGFPDMLAQCEQQFIAIGEAKTWCHCDLRADIARRWYYYKR